ncbi:MAG: universal stress protein [Candidatus Neomarinimicrobiota bacterium]
MVKRIVVAIDGSNYAKTALNLACTRAKKTGALICGVGVVDIPGITRQEAGAPAGASYYAHRAEETKIKDACTKMAGFIADFKAFCEKSGVNYEIRSHEGVPFEEIIKEANFADLIYVGVKTFFHFETNSKPGETVMRLLKYASCPVVAVPEQAEFPKNVIVALDGSRAAARGLREFVDLYEDRDIFTDINFFLVSAGTREEMLPLHEGAHHYLQAHGLTATSIIREGKPHEVILEEAKRRIPSAVVLGAYGQKGISRLFYGSTARKIVEDGSVTVLVTH